MSTFFFTYYIDAIWMTKKWDWTTWRGRVTRSFDMQKRESKLKKCLEETYKMIPKAYRTLPNSKRQEWVNEMWKKSLSFSKGNGMVHKEFIPQGQKVNAAYHVDVLERLQKRKKTSPLPSKLHHHFALYHNALRFRKFLVKYQRCPILPIVLTSPQ